MSETAAKAFSLHLPWPPSTNSLWRAFRRGSKVCNILSEGYRKWKDDAGAVLFQHKPEAISGPVQAHIILVPPSKRAFDLDNRVKAILDLIVAHKLIDADDNGTIKQLTVIAGEGTLPGAYVTVTKVAA